MEVIPVVLCGGSGTRLWPLSRLTLPKQFLALHSSRTLLQDTVLRLKGIEGLAAPIAICNEEHRFLVAEQLRESGCQPQAVVLEPEGRNTAPAVAAAALLAQAASPGALLLVLPADHFVGEGLHAAVRLALAQANAGKLVVFGVPPSSPHTGYGYIHRGARLAEGAYAVERFVEKPPREQAERFLAEGGYFWNSGMFVFRADRFLAELEKFRPAILAAVRDAVTRAQRDLDFVRLEREAFLACPRESVDYAVMEHTRDGCVVEARFPWSDIGSWAALWEAGAKDPAGNVSRGDVVTDGARNCYLHSDGRLIAAIGVEGLIVVETSDAVLVAAKDRAEDVKRTVERLRLAERAEHAVHRRSYRPWGYYESIDGGARFQVKRLMIKPGARISLQRHRRRAEHWVVVTGKARVTRGEDTLHLGPDQSTYIPLGVRHRLENVGEEPLFVVEVQSGDYLGEDDIERYSDDYRRT